MWSKELPQGSIGQKEITLQQLFDYVGFIGDQELKPPDHLGDQILTIRVEKVPDGPVPDEVRKEWVGVRINGARELVEDIETDSTGKHLRRGAWVAVPISTALPALLKHSTSAARWWATRSPMPPWLYFTKETVEVIKE